MIVYFTGTKNSEYLAKLLANQLEDEAINAAKLIKAGEKPDFESQKPYIFVTPVYAWRMPRVFEKWIRACNFSGCKSVYFVMSCGDSIGAAENYVKKLAKAIDFEYMGTAEVVMPENYLVMFTPTPESEDDEIIEKASRKIKRISEKISEGKALDRVKITFVGHLCSDVVTPFFYAFYVGSKKFYATDSCISCGACVESCMLNNITIKDGKPAWGKNCTHCMACICKCPTLAIEYGKNTKGKRRYLCKKRPL